MADLNVAVCLHGLARGSTAPSGGAYSTKFTKLLNEIIPYSPDIFIHSWDVDVSDELVEIFSPVDCFFEEQKHGAGGGVELHGAEPGR